jgi:hypothetical protein
MIISLFFNFTHTMCTSYAPTKVRGLKKDRVVDEWEMKEQDVFMYNI